MRAALSHLLQLGRTQEFGAGLDLYIQELALHGGRVDHSVRDYLRRVFL